MKFEFSAGGVIYKKSKEQYQFALILNGYDQWTFPKGHIEKKEKPEDAALREVAEEIGLNDLKIINLLEKIDYWFKLDAELIHKFVYFYLMEAPENAIITPQESEIKEALWCTKDKILTLLKYKEDIPLFKKALAYLKLK